MISALGCETYSAAGTLWATHGHQLVLALGAEFGQLSPTRSLPPKGQAQLSGEVEGTGFISHTAQSSDGSAHSQCH